MAKEKTLQDLFHDTLKDIYYAEKKILTALPKMAKAAQNPNSRPRSRSTAARPKSKSPGSNRSSPPSTRSRRARSAQPSRASSTRARRSWTSTRAMPALDAGLISAAQAVEHYEICRYGTLATWADELGNSAGAQAPQGDAQRRRKHRQSPERLG